MKKKKKWIMLIIAAYIGYLIIGMLLPFAHQKKVSGDKQKEVREKYYGNRLSCDRAAIVESSTDALIKRLQMIEGAKERIILTTFDMRTGESSSDIAGALMAAADRGVSVKILVDGMSGFVQMNGRPFFQMLSSYPNIEVRIYNKINPLKPWGIHGRMHDKYVIADKQSFLLGGRNSFDYFLGDYVEKRRSFDREVFIYNTAYKDVDNKESALYQVEDYFNKIWNAKDTKPFSYRDQSSRRAVQKELVKMKERYQKMKVEKPEWFVASNGLEEGTLPTKKVTLIAGETHILGKEPIVWEELKSLMLTAKKRVELHTPYAVLGEDMYAGVTEIVQAVPRFDIVLNSVENGDNFVASSDYQKNKKKILETGVSIYEFAGGDSTHGKSILVDDTISVVGSYNLDLRSTYMDTELMLVIDSKELNQSLEEHLMVFKSQSQKVIDEKNYEVNTELEIQEAPFYKKIGWKVLGFLMQPFRFLI